MYKIDLSGEWQLSVGCGELPPDSKLNVNSKIKGRVPGYVHIDLLENGFVANPYLNFEELKQKWIAKCAWIYEREFAIPSELLLSHNIFQLVCEGIDTVSIIRVNGTHIGQTNNEFCNYVFPLSGNLLKPKNIITVEIESPLHYAAQRAQKIGYYIPWSEYMNGEPHWNQIRKCACSFGWDWGPCFPTIGIPRPIYLCVVSLGKIENVKVLVRGIDKQTFTVDVSTIYTWNTTTNATPQWKVELRSLSEENKVVAETTRMLQLTPHVVQCQLEVKNPKLWWPAGYGCQPLYEVVVTLAVRTLNDSNVVSAARKITAFRKVELIREPDTMGESFYFKINGVPIFIKGANWIPPDCFPLRVSRQHVEGLLRSALNANMNCIRIWGGGRYERDEFYEFCDANGLLIWHDFMFACALYPTDTEFLTSVKMEVTQQLWRLSGHPSILIWCGNNENEELLASDWKKTELCPKERYLIDYHILYIETLYRTIQNEDPTIIFWPSSPSNGLSQWGNPAEPSRGDIHYWGVWHGNKPFSVYLEIKPRFCSEFGFQSFPSLKTLAQVLNDIDDWNVNSPALDFRQRSPLLGNKAIVEHIMRQFRFPVGFENFVYVSQILQALAIKTAVEHWRRLKPYCMGTIYWQLNDIWQGPSWSSLEYDGSWKILHHFARKFFAPLLISSFVNKSSDSFEIWLTSDLMNDVVCNLNVEMWNIETSRKLAMWSFTVDVPKLSNITAWTQKIVSLSNLAKDNQDDLCKCLFVYSAKSDDEHEAENIHLFGDFKSLKLTHPHIAVDVLNAKDKQIEVQLTSDRIAPFVYLRATSLQGNWSDNGFWLFPNEPKKVVFSLLDSSEANPTPEHFKEELKIVSLRDSY